MSTLDHVALRKAYEGRFGRLEDKACPAESVVNRRMQELEQGVLKAESLQEMLCKEEYEDQPEAAVWTKEGTLEIKRASQKVPLSTDSEALRKRVRLLGMTCSCRNEEPGSGLA